MRAVDSFAAPRWKTICASGRESLGQQVSRPVPSESQLTSPSNEATVLLKGKMMTAHVNEMGIVLRFDSPLENLSPDGWESLLDELKSHYIPSFYGYGKRMSVDVSATGQMRAVIYFTPNTVTIDEAIPILKKRHIAVFDVRKIPAPEL
jgi:hypothetical protein